MLNNLRLDNRLIILISLLFSFFVGGVYSAEPFKKSILPKDNEELVYTHLNEKLHLKEGDAHPLLNGWIFYTAHEFLDAHTDNDKQPLGFIEHKTPFMSRMAKVANKDCAKVEDNILKIVSRYYIDSIDNDYGKNVNLKTAAFRTSPIGSDQAWCKFTENMRIEVRLRRSDSEGVNNALWFMGNNNRQWPENGEIDLLENPKKKVNQKAHFTLHSKNFFAGTMGGKGSTTASIELEDMTKWNIYWIEWYPDSIIGGVNGQPYFKHIKNTNGNTDWPWSDIEGFFMLITTGISTNPNAWPGTINYHTWLKDGLPSMDVDWIRVYINKEFEGEKAPSTKYY